MKLNIGSYPIKPPRIILIILLPILLLLGGFLVINSRPLIDFPERSAGVPVAVSIEAGDTGEVIASKLAEKGVILKSATFFKLAISNPRARSISPGIHMIDSHITSKMALEQLLESARISGLIRVQEGSTLSDVLKALQASQINGALGQIKSSGILGNVESLEGRLAPATYAFPEKSSTTQALQTMVDRFERSLHEIGLPSKFERYSNYELLTIASLIQIEGDPGDYAKVSRVIYNRLAIGMPLQLNSTVQYAAHTRGRIALSKNATKIDSPYNTYIHVGLPPTPICNPSSAALRASFHPSSGNWLYFVTVKPHDTRFTSSFTEFQGWVTMYNNNLANGAFK